LGIWSALPTPHKKKLPAIEMFHRAPDWRLIICTPEQYVIMMMKYKRSRTCYMHGREEKFIYDSVPVGQSKGRRLLGRPRHTW